MPFISVTRLRLRSVRFLPAFMFYTVRSHRQARRAGGFQGGWLGTERGWGFWTATVWNSLEDMRTFRNSPPHLRAMARLLHWCDEASFVHWEQADGALPDSETAFRRLRDEGRSSKVLHPSPRHREGRTAGDIPPRAGAAATPA